MPFDESIPGPFFALIIREAIGVSDCMLAVWKNDGEFLSSSEKVASHSHGMFCKNLKRIKDILNLRAFKAFTRVCFKLVTSRTHASIGKHEQLGGLLIKHAKKYGTKHM